MVYQGYRLIVIPSLLIFSAGLFSCHVPKSPRVGVADAKQPATLASRSKPSKPASDQTAGKKASETVKPQIQETKPKAAEAKLSPAGSKPSPANGKSSATPTETAEKTPPVMKPSDPVKPPPAQAAKSITVSNNNVTRIIETKGEDVNIDGDDGLILINGGCRILTVRGKNNQIQVDSADEIVIAGNGNHVASNKLGSGRITGNQNKLTWQSGMIAGLNPIIQSSGAGNESKSIRAESIESAVPR